MHRIRKISLVMGGVTLALALLCGQARAGSAAGKQPISIRATATFQDGEQPCLLVIPISPVVAPNQPPVQPQSTIGIINALCDVKLDIVGCLFGPTSVKINCDVNGDGVPETAIPLTNIRIVNRFLVEATIPALSPQLPGSAFPLTCCGGPASITLTRTVGAGDDNIFGPFTLTQTCPIDLGIRTPVVISASPSGGNCQVAQDLLLPGSCYLLADGTHNVTSVFAVERGNPANVIQSKQFVILNTNLIDALFDFGAANAGKTFLIYASGPNGTSRNLITLPTGAPAGCPLGNEQGVQVSFACTPPPGGPTPPDSTPPKPEVTACRLDRDASGAFNLTITGRLFSPDAQLTVGGIKPKKVKFRDIEEATQRFTKVVAKGRFCDGLPGLIVVTNPSSQGAASVPFMCDVPCQP
jgi:hypothetical protein